ncbi:MarR family winged helix-turn-helix transcriptional regulator [Nocardia sp. NPDC057668]|uniref:MarR family winged helix-turn-helix transcriptional regulator n=1 Tax=Nocardia sp. NPDC057668 TaxID=3346202 RepID=UPI00366FD931
MAADLDPRSLDTGTLALFAGQAAAAQVQASLSEDGFGDLRMSHGYLFQHLIAGEPTITELAAHLSMTQQGASKAVAELERLGYCERTPDPSDARIRRIRLTPRGHAAVAAARRARAALETRLAARFGESHLAAQRTFLTELLAELGGIEAVERRAVLPPH